jgi:hypothetical protein
VSAAEEPPAYDSPKQPSGEEPGDDQSNCGEHREHHHDANQYGEHCVAEAPWLALARQVRDQRVKLAIGSRAEGGAQPLLELLGDQPPLGRGLAQALGDVLAI